MCLSRECISSFISSTTQIRIVWNNACVLWKVKGEYLEFFKNLLCISSHYYGVKWTCPPRKSGHNFVSPHGGQNKSRKKRNYFYLFKRSTHLSKSGELRKVVPFLTMMGGVLYGRVQTLLLGLLSYSAVFPLIHFLVL